MITRKSYLSRTALGSSAFTLAMALAVAAPAAAQVAGSASTSAPGPAAGNSDEVIVVTGSRIARPDLDSPSPVTTVDAKAINLTGTITVETLLNELPQLIPGNTRVSNNQGGESFSTLDLRGLGPQRTLILVNGERLPASSTSGVVDVATIPTGLIQRIDVVTGGASAVYGSDAIAGVVNFVLKDNFQGLELSSQYGISQRGDGDEFNVQGTFGGDFADGKGNIAVFASYFTREGVSQADRKFSRGAGVVVYNANSNTYRTEFDAANFNAANGDSLALGAGGSATNQYGVVSSNAGNPFNVSFPNVDSDCDPSTPGVTRSGNLSLVFGGNGVAGSALRPLPSSAGRCGFPSAVGSARFNFNPLNLLVTPYKRYTFSAVGHYDITDDITFKVLGNFVRSSQTVNLAPTPATNFLLPYNAPFVTPALAAALATRPNPTAPFIFNRRFLETGPRIGTFTSNSYNIRATLEGKFSDKWSWNATASYGEVQGLEVLRNNINKTAVTQGVNNCPLGSLPNCVPINLFGANSLTPAMLNFVRLDTKESRDFSQLRVVGNVTGTLLELPAGPVGVAVGAEYRKDRGTITVDDAQRTGNLYGFNATQSQRGAVDVKEVYGEVRVPLLGDMPFVNSLSVEAGARYSDYSSVGHLFNWKAGAEFAPVKWLRFRGIYNVAARAPAIVELFQNGDQGFATYTDPCNDTTRRTAATLALCQAQAPGFNFAGFSQSNSQVQAFAFGNPSLSEERAKTYTLGVVLAPARLPFGTGKASLTIDYYNIKIKDEIGALGAAFFISNCFTGGNTSGGCQRIQRNAGTGQIDAINTSVANQDSVNTSGIDANLDIRIPISDVFSSVPGAIHIGEVFTWVNSYKLNGGELVGLSEAGIGAEFPRYKSTLSVSYESESFTGLLRWNFSSHLQQDFDGRGEPSNPIQPALSYFDLSLNQKIGDNFDLTFICNNFLDAQPKVQPIGFFDQANVDTTTYSNIILGRTFTVQARVRF